MSRTTIYFSLQVDIDGLMQDYGHSIALAMEWP